LPAPAQLALQLSVDKGEIQRAYYELERTGLVKKKTGRDFLGKEKTTYLVEG
jgi:DNA-binding transcriptional regulator YhcF (GntR family)